uniref:Maltase-glucoamylase, intestinal-like n=1 Tax=Cyanistes caeruleus TaxID=156563 RepID=A0A8C0UNJ2_CYACU
GVPWCFFSSEHGYRLESGPHTTTQGTAGLEFFLRRLPSPSLFGAAADLVRLQAQFQSSARLRLQFTDPKKQQFEVPHDHIGPFSGPATSDPKYRLKFQENPFGIQVIRASTGKVIFDTTIGPLVFSEQFLQISTRIPSSNVYGLGEHLHRSFRHDLHWKTWPLFSRHAAPSAVRFWAHLHAFGTNLPGIGDKEVALTPAPAVTFRTIGGILDFYIFLGDTPEQVVQEYVQFIGLPALPPYWALGFQLSHRSYGSLDEVKAVVERNRAIGLPYDVQYTDIDAMDGCKDFTYDKIKFHDLPNFREFLNAAEQKFVIVLDAAIAMEPMADGSPYRTFERGQEKRVWVNESDGVTPLIGEARPGQVVFPDFSNPVCVEWWEQEFQRFHELIPYDGIWIDMNEAASFIPGSTRGVADWPLFRRSLCLDAVQSWGRQYDVHSLYGHSMALATLRALGRLSPGRRSFLVSGSTFAGSGRLGGHWLGDNAATWDHLRWATPALLEFGLFGIPYVGAAICGSLGAAPEELCRRWMQLGAFYPLARNHNHESSTPQDPAAFGANSVLVNSSRHYLSIRYHLLPYLYSLFYRAHTRGDTVARPLLHEFYAEEATWDVNGQFLWGPGLLITPVLEPGSRLWMRKQWTHLYLPADKLGLHLRGGHIFPVQHPATTTAASRRNPMGLIVALDENQEATGELFWDDGESAGETATVAIVQGLRLRLGQSYSLHWTLGTRDSDRFDCHPAEGASRESCEHLGCIWNVSDHPESIYDSATQRYEVPVPLSLPGTPQASVQRRLYDVTIQERPFGVQVRRRSSGTVIWDSQLPTFTFSDQFLQISTHLPAPFVFGFGETEHDAFRHNLDWHTWGMFTRDQPPGYKLNSYGFQPFYMGLEKDGNAHGVLLLNSNAMGKKTPQFLFFSMYFSKILHFSALTWGLVGRPVMPAYWALGFQLCRYGYENDAEIAQLVNDMNRAQIPLDVQYADIDYMERQLDFTLSPRFQGLPELVQRIQSNGMRFILILDPAISANETNYPAYDRGVQQDVFIKWPDSDDLVYAKVWPDLPNVVVNDSLDWDTQVELYRAFAAMPDFFRNSTKDWWAQEIAEVYENPRNSSLSIKFDGLWIDMNEPSSFVHGTIGGCRDRNLNFPPYMPQLGSRSEGLSFKTVCMEGQQQLPDGSPVRHYDVHNLYGWAQTKPTLDILRNLTGERGIVVTRSTFPSSGRWAGHWLGDNTAAWNQLDKSIIGEHPKSCFPTQNSVGADICGFFGEPSYELCARWMELGAFYPYSRNHNGNKAKRQDPVAWNSTFADLSRAVLQLRYRLLPHLYTLMLQAHVRGSTVVRPLLHEFVEDRTTWDIYRQFMWGAGLLISPVLEPGVSEVRAYLPDARWFNFHTVGFRRQFQNFPAPLGHINLHVRGGHILPQQLPANNTWFSRRNPLLLTVALDDAQEASGNLYWDDGVGIGQPHLQN